MSLALRSRGQEAVITGDLMHHPIQCAEPEWNSVACTDGEQARATRRAFLERHADRDVWVLGTHFVPPTVGRLVSHRDHFRFRV